MINTTMKTVITGLIAVSIFSCKKDKTETPDDSSINNTCELTPINSSSNVVGFGILEKLSGIWNGPVYSPTPLGSFSEWIVDFRPISPSQISAKNELDSLNDIFMSFFIARYDCEYKIAFRNGGGFAGAVRNSYMIIDSLNENSSQSFYRFVDPVSGGNRVYADIVFKQDSLIMHVYTNQLNKLSEPVTHMIWTANLRDTTSVQDVISLFNFPQKELTKDFSTTFDSLTEAVFYSASDDPYPEQEQPYLGNSNINITITNPPTIDPGKKILIIITTRPLFSGFTFVPANLDYRSRYVFVGADSPTGYNFNYMHPGNYYVNAIYDNNGDYNFSSGDYMNSSFDIPFTMTDNGAANADVTINFQIP
ncbi:MAG: hypothetical protein IIA88_07115 [Bacteroidetes bacterium]|nr:hypothetical protein [Bacteroidota bacterium]